MVAIAAGATAPSLAQQDSARRFMAEAMRARKDAIAAGDQPYGAVLVKDNRIIGRGPSRVVVDRDNAAHAERIALRDARIRESAEALVGATLYSTSIPCAACQQAAAQAGVAKMIYGEALRDGGAPRGI